MPSYLNKIVYLTEVQKATLFSTGTVTANGKTITYNENDLYLTTDGTLPISGGGTGASSATDARTNLGLGTIATESASDYVKVTDLHDASTSQKGIVQIGNGISVNNGVISVTADNLGLSNALHFIGITSTSLSDGATTSSLTPKTTGSLTKTTGFEAGDVVIDSNSSYEYVWTGSIWERLGPDGDYKVKQTAIENSTGTADGSNTSTSFIYSFSQNDNGNVSVKTRTLDTSGTWSGIATKATQDSDGNAINTTYIKKSVLSGAYDIMYSSAANTPTRLAANTTTTKKFLSMTGTGSAGATPSWSTVSKSDVGLGDVTNHQQVHEVAWDSTNKKITRSKNGTAGDVVSFSAGTGISLTAAAGSLTIGHSNSITAKTAYGSETTTASADGGTITVTDVKYDAQGHITTSTDRTITLSQVKNTAGSTDTSSKIYLIGATSQADNPQTYSDDEVFVTDGTLSTRDFTVSGDAFLNGETYADSATIGNLEVTGSGNFIATNGFTYGGIGIAGSGTTDSDRPIWFNHASATGRPFLDNEFLYNPVTNTLTVGQIKVAGPNGYSSNTITSDSSTNIHFKINNKATLVVMESTIRSGNSVAGTVDLGTSTNKWNTVYANYFNGSGENLTSLNASNISSGTVPFARLPSIYWANLATTDTAIYNAQPEVQSVKIGNGTTATATKSVQLVYDSTLEVLNFVFA